MAKTSRQTAIFGTEDWQRIYKTYKEADLQSYNFETIRKTFVDYLRQHHPETFNDYTESSEYIALLDLMAFMGQSLAFRSDLNTRENFLDTAERRDSVNNLATLVGYTPKRNETARGYLKILAASTTENIVDYNKNNLGNVAIRWNDKTNDDWQEQLTTILSAALINSQKIGQPGRTANIVGIRTDEYEINMSDGFLPVVPFSATVDGSVMDFEIVNGTSIGKDSIYEPAPSANGQLNLLYRNDNQGFASPNTGYFFYFKQGTLQTQDFTLSERIANISIDIDIPGINNDDVWLFKTDATTSSGTEEWDEVSNVYTSNNTQLAAGQRKFFSVTSRVNDQIAFNFGDGVFSEIPIGDFRTYIRESNGLEYVINPEEIQNIDVNISYTSKTGRDETLTLTIGLQQPISNAKGNESIDDIKRRAPARFYTQNRMVNGEDYNNFPYTAHSSITKSKAINRTNIGASRYLDLVDPTGKYSSINAYASDGLIYKDTNLTTFNFTFNDRNDIDSVFRNQVEPLLGSRGTIQFYYENFTRVALPAAGEITRLIWQQNTTITNETSGYFKNSEGNARAIGPFVNDNRQHLLPQSLVKFVAPAGLHFDENNRLQAGVSNHAGDKTEIWTTITSVEVEGTLSGAAAPGNTVGPVKINNFVPTGAEAEEIIPLFNSDLSVVIEQEMLTQVELLRNFGIGFDHLNNIWYVISADNLDDTSEFSLSNAQSTSNTNADASWMVKFISTPEGYTVSTRALNYFFASILETRFFYDNSRKIFDPRSGQIVNDFINVLKINTKPDGSHNPLSSDVVMDIIDQSVEPDGYVNDYNVEVSFTDFDNDGIADNPDYFKLIVDESGINLNRNVYFQSTVDFDNLERLLPVTSATINDEYETEGDIALVKTEHVAGQIFYATAEDKFFELQVENGTIRELIERFDYTAKIGRDNLHFQYRHNSPETRRINPSVTNIIDVYVVTANYYDSHLRYIQDVTNSVEEPAVPTTDELSVQYDDLQESKMISDNMVLSSVVFKPLFGNKADTQLQAFIKVVKVSNTTTSDSEIKSSVISTINEYFDIDNWDFGDTFYFSELAAFIHSQLGDTVASIVITSKDPSKTFGDLYEIKSAPYEIFTSAATVDDVTIIDALTASNIQTKAG